jgi:hypothetical protein
MRVEIGEQGNNLPSHYHSNNKSLKDMNRDSDKIAAVGT